MTWETIIGLETHVELATRTKIFCSCTTEFGGAPNTHCCPVCTGMPGTLPVLNQQVVELVKAQHAKAKQILTENSAKLHELAKYLYEKETITGQEFMEILEGGGAA